MRATESAAYARPRDRGRPSYLAVPALLSALYVAQCLWFIGTQSLTYDEPTHILAGLDAWQHGRFEQWNDQPPLARLLLTVPLLGGAWQLEPLAQPLSGAFWTIAIHPSLIGLAWHTRPVNVMLGLALGWLLWTTARRLYSEGGANLAFALFALSPPVIAHFSLATVDGSAALLVFATAVATVRWRERPSWQATLALGFVLGAMLLTKFSAPPLVLLTLVILMATRSAGVPLTRRLAHAGVALVLAIAVVWAAYGFHVGPVTFRNGSLSRAYAPARTVYVPLSTPMSLTMTVPAPEYVTALGLVAQHSVRGQPAFFMGEIKPRGGWWTYFPAVAILKWPPVVWLLASVAVVLWIRRRYLWPTDLAVLLLFPAVIFALAMTSNLDVGDRYILPVYSFLLLLCAGFVRIVGPPPRRARWSLVAIAIGLQAADAFRYAPDYLSYFTVFVEPNLTYELLSDSNLDWGQGLIALREYERTHPRERITLAYFGGVNPAQYGVRAEPLGEGQRATGTVVVSATHLSGQYLQDPAAYRWLLPYPRTAILNHTLHVFTVPDFSNQPQSAEGGAR